MGKNKKKSGSHAVGSMIIKDRFAKNKQHRSADSFLHTSELNDGFDWGRLNLQSVTEQNQLDDFLATAELAGTEFTAEKLNVEVISSGPVAAPGLLTQAERNQITEIQDKHRTQLKIPRRPNWHGGMSGEELQALERQDFLDWRRSLAELQEIDQIVMTPFERNLDFWRQLWRVIERSDIVVQIVDSRNPLQFRCEDLELYVKEVDKSKVNVILINKSDYLTAEQRQHWCDFFNKEGLKVFFWSAKLETERQEESAQEEEEVMSEEDEDAVSGEQKEERMDAAENSQQNDTATETTASDDLNVPTLFTATELVEQLKALKPPKTQQDGILTIGLVGYPNVGKSSTINAILQAKKCPVSATPGRTKHFQTVYIDSDTMLCDCPGLVMPSFVTTKADMILNGILPIDQMRDHRPAVNTLAQKIPRQTIESIYSISLRKPKEGEDPNRAPTDIEILNAYGAMRGFMTSAGVPDAPRSARILLKDYVNGKLLYSEAPPGVSPSEYICTPVITHTTHTGTHISTSDRAADRLSESNADIEIVIDNSASKKLDSDFFKQSSSGVHAKGKKATLDPVTGKPIKRHSNKNKREKARRLYSHLDQHDNY